MFLLEPLKRIIAKYHPLWCTPNLFYRLKCEFKEKTTKEQEVGAHSLTRSTLGVEGRAGAQDGDYEKWQASITHMDLHNPNNKLVSA
jgi:hypothetical protein